MRGKSLVLALMLLMPAGVVIAQTGSSAEAPVASLTVEGTLVSTSANSLDIEKTGGSRMAFTLAPNVTLPNDLPLGSSVSVTYSELPAGQFQASHVVPLVSAPAAASTTVAAEGGSGYGAPANAQDPAGSTTSSSQEPEALPKTASTLPLLALFGITLLAAALWLRFFCQRAPQR